MKQIEILGIKIDVVTFEQALRIMNNFVLLKKPSHIITVNPEYIMKAKDDLELKAISKNSDLSVPDGAGLIFVSKYFLKNSINERVAGADLFLALCKQAEKRRYPIFLLGGQSGVAGKTADVLKKMFPNIIISGTYAGFPNFNSKKFMDFRQLRMTDIKPSKNDPNLEIVTEVRKAKPKILFVAYGAPKQEKFIARYKKILNVPVMIGVGGTFDFISGKAIRAPKWMQKLWLEWLWRLFHEPWRFDRIFTATVRFPLAVLNNLLFKRDK